MAGVTLAGSHFHGSRFTRHSRCMIVKIVGTISPRRDLLNTAGVTLPGVGLHWIFTWDSPTWSSSVKLGVTLPGNNFHGIIYFT